jgi:triacylglycerol lipase
MSPQSFDPMQAYNYGVFVEVAYQMFNNNPGNLTPPVPENFPSGYKLVVYLTAVDSIPLVKERKFYGFIAQSTTNLNEYIGAVRGTDGFIEWLIDSEFFWTTFTPVPAAGDVEDGFFSIYDSMTGILAGEQTQRSPNEILAQLSSENLTIVGHSLGGAIANMWALDVAVNYPVKQLTLYTLAAPRVGFDAWADCFNQNVPNSFRVYNEPDLVPKLPPLYDQVNTGEEIDSKLDTGIKHSIACYHELITYLHVLNPNSVFPLNGCAKKN